MGLYVRAHVSARWLRDNPAERMHKLTQRGWREARGRAAPDTG